MTNIFAKELRGRNITVNAVAPGPTATELFLKDKTADQIEHLAKMPPLERLGRPEDIANVVAFLVGPDGACLVYAVKALPRRPANCRNSV